jgi:hypothetical protein
MGVTVAAAVAFTQPTTSLKVTAGVEWLNGHHVVGKSVGGSGSGSSKSLIWQ